MYKFIYKSKIKLFFMAIYYLIILAIIISFILGYLTGNPIYLIIFIISGCLIVYWIPYKRGINNEIYVRNNEIKFKIGNNYSTITINSIKAIKVKHSFINNMLSNMIIIIVTEFKVVKVTINYYKDYKVFLYIVIKKILDKDTVNIDNRILEMIEKTENH